MFTFLSSESRAKLAWSMPSREEIGAKLNAQCSMLKSPYNPCLYKDSSRMVMLNVQCSMLNSRANRMQSNVFELLRCRRESNVV